MFLKVALLLDLGVTVVAASFVDAASQRVILIAGALTALGLLWRTFGRPIAKIVKRTAAAVDELEGLPKWREEHDERLSALEGEVGLAIPAINNVQNDVSAIRRELGITDDLVRHPPTSV